MTESQKPHKVLKDELMGAFRDAGEQERKFIAELRKFRAQVPLIAITVLTAVTPFAKDYTDFMFAFFVAYALLFASAIFGVLGVEGLLKCEIKWFGQFQSTTCDIIEQLKQKENVDDAMKKFGEQRVDDLDEQLFNHLSDLSIKLFLIGLAMLFISVFPWNLLVEFWSDVIDKILK
jgi:hypothetical protein